MGGLVALWLGLTALLLWWVSSFPFPFEAAREARVADDAFRFLMRMASPVFALVVSTLVYVLAARRGNGEPPKPPPYVPEHRLVPRVWFLATALLAAYVIYNPGLVGLREIRGALGHRYPHSVHLAVAGGMVLGSPQGELVVRVRASRWLWTFSYPGQGVRDSRELVLPLGRPVRFEVTSTDVIHSFWVPAFRTKIDAVPNLTTFLHVTPTRTGSFEQTVDLRVQCAELCGVGHAIMAAPVRIIEPEAFEAWVAEQARR
jgi:cytochrome c oxidase subunit 2